MAYERQRFDVSTLDDDLAIAAVTVAEFRTGIELADDAQGLLTALASWLGCAR